MKNNGVAYERIENKKEIKQIETKTNKERNETIEFKQNTCFKTFKNKIREKENRRRKKLKKEREPNLNKKDAGLCLLSENIFETILPFHYH